jgi:hypothetical protein
MIAALLASLTCAATPIHYETLPRSGSLNGIPWVQGSPLRRGFFGLLYAYDKELGPNFALYTRGQSPHGHIEKVLWIVRNRYAGGWLTVRGHEIGGTATFRQRFKEVIDASEEPAVGHEFASNVVLPDAGCWRLTVQSGRRAKATFIVEGFDW